MPTLPREIYTRRSALVQELGFDPKRVIADSFDEHGFITIEPGRGQEIIRGNELIQRRIYWPDQSWAKRALDAVQGDFAEKFGLITTQPPDQTGATG